MPHEIINPVKMQAVSLPGRHFVVELREHRRRLPGSHIPIEVFSVQVREQGEDGVECRTSAIMDRSAANSFFEMCVKGDK